MTLFSRPKPTDAGPTLPAGFDDPESETFVPEPLRLYWRDATPNLPSLPGLIDDRIEAEARERAEALQRADWETNRTRGNTGRRGEFVFDGRPYATYPIADQIRRIRNSPDDLARLEASAVHALRLASAADAAALAARFAERERRETCPICGEHFPAGASGVPVVKPRTFVGVRGASFQRTCCAECSNAARVAHDEWLRTHVVRDGKTRVQLVAEAIATR